MWRGGMEMEMVSHRSIPNYDSSDHSHTVSSVLVAVAVVQVAAALVLVSVAVVEVTAALVLVSVAVVQVAAALVLVAAVVPSAMEAVGSVSVPSFQPPEGSSRLKVTRLAAANEIIVGLSQSKR